MIQVTEEISLDEAELAFTYVRASGPGGQNVNKVSSAVQLRFDVRGSRSLPEAVKDRLADLAGQRLTREGVLVINAREHRSQEMNRQAAIGRLLALVRQAAELPRERRPTRPGRAARAARLDAKRMRGESKARRRPIGRDDY
ncbi:MAG: alternative ribosome rescue aminoacyl-tRNA hydrolase ArfB [Polyangia bacterium]|jgi:ribosome-associated protein|nr:alternative ribosome rescue aminoacyl-tRNA hydrolase ArfB [Polyangia bacterium]